MLKKKKNEITLTFWQLSSYILQTLMISKVIITFNLLTTEILPINSQA